jgi:hypothetical protein
METASSCGRPVSCYQITRRNIPEVIATSVYSFVIRGFKCGCPYAVVEKNQRRCVVVDDETRSDIFASSDYGD